MSVSSAAIVSKDRNLEGIAWMVATGICFAIVTAIVRYLGSNLPAVEAAFIRYFIGLLIMGPVLIKYFRVKFSPKLWGGFLIRGLVHGIGVILWFYAMARIPIAEVTAIGYMAPIFTTVGAAIFLHEVLHVRRILAVVISFLGAIIILRPGIEVIELGSLAQLLAAPGFAASFLLAKKLTATRSSTEIVVMLSIFCTLVLLPGALLQWRQPTPNELYLLLLTAVFATAGHFALTRAFACAPITVTQPVLFLQLIWASLLGYFAFGETPDPWVIVGGGIIIVSVTYISHREVLVSRVKKVSVEKYPKGTSIN
jgi:drug/metabolite transporter (DMT)-like permease